MKIKKKNYPLWILLLTILVLMSIAIILFAELELPSIKSSSGIIAIISAFIGVLITMSVTSLLLNKQSEVEGLKDQSIIQFEKKQEVYHSFLEKVETMIVELTEKSMRGNDKQAYDNITKLESFIFQFGYLHIHMREDNFIKVIKNISEIMKTYNKIRLHELYVKEIKDKSASSSSIVNDSLLLLMQTIVRHLFNISQLLNEDLYEEAHKYNGDEAFEEMNVLLGNCGLKRMTNNE